MTLEDRFVKDQQSFVSESNTCCIWWLESIMFQLVIWWHVVNWNSKGICKSLWLHCSTSWKWQLNNGLSLQYPNKTLGIGALDCTSFVF